MTCNTQIAIGAGRFVIFFSVHLRLCSQVSCRHVTRCMCPVKRELPDCSLLQTPNPHRPTQSTCKKRNPSLLSNLTSTSILSIPMLTTSSRLRHYLWRRKILIETTFAINALEPWEKMIFFSVLSLLLFLLFRGICRIFPSQLVVVQQRAAYYLWGTTPRTGH